MTHGTICGAMIFKGVGFKGVGWLVGWLVGYWNTCPELWMMINCRRILICSFTNVLVRVLSHHNLPIHLRRRRRHHPHHHQYHQWEHLPSRLLASNQ